MELLTSNCGIGVPHVNLALMQMVNFLRSYSFVESGLIFTSSGIYLASMVIQLRLDDIAGASYYQEDTMSES